jgi:hypothetical protein
MNALANCLAGISLLSGLAVALTTAVAGMLGTFSNDLKYGYYRPQLREDSSTNPHALQGVLLILSATIWISVVAAVPFLGSNIIELTVFGFVGYLVGVQFAHGLWELGKSRIFDIRATPLDLFDDGQTDGFGSNSTPST